MISKYVYGGLGLVIAALVTTLTVGYSNYERALEDKDARIEVLTTNVSQLESAIATSEETIKFLKQSSNEQKAAFKDLQQTVNNIPEIRPEIITIVEEADPVVAQEIARKDIDASLSYIELATSPN